MKQNGIQLNQAVVTGELKEMEVKDDTLIFNADAFKVPEGSVLEDLIKKLPGVTIEDGTIKVNGKTVRRILVGGKEFFGNDQNMSMKNLPAEIVDKVKTYDKQSDFSRITGIDDGEEETVLDLTIKKGFQQGWFGNIDAGYGTEKLYTGRLMLRHIFGVVSARLVGWCSTPTKLSSVETSVSTITKATPTQRVATKISYVQPHIVTASTAAETAPTT